MPLVTLDQATQRPPTGGARNTTRGSGRRDVTYRDAQGKEWGAKVIAAGSVSGLLLEVIGLGRIDNVAVATAINQNSRYYNRFA
jgi:hypothetical protein